MVTTATGVAPPMQRCPAKIRLRWRARAQDAYWLQQQQQQQQQQQGGPAGAVSVQEVAKGLQTLQAAINTSSGPARQQMVNLLAHILREASDPQVSHPAPLLAHRAEGVQSCILTLGCARPSDRCWRTPIPWSCMTSTLLQSAGTQAGTSWSCSEGWRRRSRHLTRRQASHAHVALLFFAAVSSGHCISMGDERDTWEQLQVVQKTQYLGGPVRLHGVPV